jgi:hypothetical protein
VRWRAKLVALRSGLKAQVHLVLAKEGVAVPMSDLFGNTGLELLAQVRLSPAYQLRVTSLVDLIEVYDGDVDRFRHYRHPPGRRPWLPGDPGHPRRGAVLAAVFTAEIGDIKLSLTASRIGRRSSSVVGSISPSAPRSKASSNNPSASNASMNTTWICVEVSSAETIVASHFRVTRSMTAVAPMPSQPRKMRCVIDPDAVLGVGDQSGNGVRAEVPDRFGCRSMSP